MPRRSISPALLAVLVLAALAGCGSHTRSAAPSASVVSVDLKGSPPALARLHEQANQLLPGGPSAFHARLSALHGYPVVVNKWASWCQPCQSEFPVFQRVAVSYGRRVAFVGLDASDHASPARQFLAQFPVTYPSYSDPRQAIADSIQAAAYMPQTVFYDGRGKMVFDHAGSYLSVSDLERDIRRYALGQQ